MRRENKWTRFRRWAKRTPGQLLSAVGGFITGVSQLVDDDLRLQLLHRQIPLKSSVLSTGLVIVVVGTLVAAGRELRQQKENTDLKRDNENLRREKAEMEAQYADTLAAIGAIGDDVAFRLGKELRLGNSERITLFVKDDSGFRQVGRYASRTRYNVEGRGRYPRNHGCMGVAWDEGAAEVTDLPDPEADLNKYCREVKRRVKMAVGVTKLQSMHSRSYAARRIEDASGQTPIGVVVIESLKPDGVSRGRLDEYLDSGNRLLEVAHLLRVLSRVKPEAGVAREAGF